MLALLTTAPRLQSGSAFFFETAKSCERVYVSSSSLVGISLRNRCVCARLNCNPPFSMEEMSYLSLRGITCAARCWSLTCTCPGEIGASGILVIKEVGAVGV
jgi:hypothetical protein